MPFKLNISDKGKAWKIEIENETLVGKVLGEIVQGKEISSDLEGYEFEITGASDIAGFPHKKDIEGQGLRKVLFSAKGWGMHAKKPGLRLRKTIRGNQISEKTVQINFKVMKEGKKNLEKVFPEQNATQQKEINETSSETKESPKEEVKTEGKAQPEPTPEPETPEPSEPEPETPEPSEPEPEKPEPTPEPTPEPGEPEEKE